MSEDNPVLIGSQGSSWSDREKIIYASLRPKCTTPEVHEVFQRLGFNRSKEALSRRGRRIGIQFSGLGDPDLGDLSKEDAEAAMAVISRRNDTSIDEAEAETDEETRYYGSKYWKPTVRPPRPIIQATIADLRGKLDKIYEETQPRNTRTEAYPENSNGTTAILLLTDLHFGNRTNQFNTQIASERIKGIPTKLAPFLPRDLEEIIVCLGGDIVEGEEIYATQQSNLDVTLIYQIDAAVEAIWSMLINLQSTTGVKLRIVTSPGNHGRMSKTAHESTNWDNVVYSHIGVLLKMHNSGMLSGHINYNDFVSFTIRDKV